MLESQPPRGIPILILGYYYPPMNASGAQRPFRFAKYLSSFGYLPYVICADSPEHRANPCKTVEPVTEPISGLRHNAIRIVQKILVTTPAAAPQTTYLGPPPSYRNR